MENATEKVNQDLTDPLSLVLNGDSGIGIYHLCTHTHTHIHI